MAKIPVHNVQHVFRDGVSIGNSSDGRSNVPLPLPVDLGWKIYYEQFNSGVDYADATPWEITVEGTTPTTTAANNGIRLDTLATDNTSVLVQHNTPQILITNNAKKMYFETSIVVDGGASGTMTDLEWFVGFTSDQQTTNFVGATGVAWAFDDGFGFGHLDTDTVISFYARQSDVEQSISLGSDLVDETRTRLGMYYDGTDYVLYKDGVRVASAARSVFNNDAAMGLALYVKSGEAVIKTLTCHYMLLATEL